MNSRKYSVCTSYSLIVVTGTYDDYDNDFETMIISAVVAEDDDDDDSDGVSISADENTLAPESG